MRGRPLVDTCDSLLVVAALERGRGDAASALYFSAGLTGASALASLSIGAVEGVGLVAPLLPGAVGRPCAALAAGLDDHTTAVGLGVVGLFAAALGLASLGPAFARAVCCCGANKGCALVATKEARYQELV